MEVHLEGNFYGIIIALIITLPGAIGVLMTYLSDRRNRKNQVIIAAKVEEAAAVVKLDTAAQTATLSAKVEDVHKVVNSRLTELVEVTRRAAHAEGHAEGVQDEKNREKK